jgi:photosystem II stability/assembly factor-like uncharacterized protein
MKTLRSVPALGLAFGGLLLLQVPPLPSPPDPQQTEPHAQNLDREDAVRRRQWDVEWYGDEWSPEYRQQLFEVGVSQRIKHANTFRLPESMRKATFLGAPAPGENWINLGPTDGGVDFQVTEQGKLYKYSISASDSGRPNQIVPHPLEPDTVFVVSAEGGLWKTEDGGGSWVVLTDALPSLALGSLAIDPVKPSILYLGLGDIQERTFGGTGTGMLKSVDGGKTWSDPLALKDSNAVTTILVHPNNTAVVLAGTDKGLFRSDNSGTSYEPVSLPEGSPSTIRDITWIEGSRIILTAGSNFDFGNGAGGANILISEDSGVTWKEVKGLNDRDEIRRFSLAAAPSNRLTVYALASSTSSELHEIYRSKDGGETWSSMNAQSAPYTNPILDDRVKLGSILGGQGGYNQLVIVDPTNPDVVFFGGNLNLVKTTDGGTTYDLISDWLGEHDLPYVHADFHCAAFDVRGNLWIGNDGGLAKSPDGGATWSTSVNKGLATHLAYSVSSSHKWRNLIIAGLQDNGTRIRVGNTTTFAQRIYADGFGALAHPTDKSLLLGSAYFTRILKSRDGGVTFHGSYQGILEANDNFAAPFNTRIIPWEGDTTGNTIYTFVNKLVYKSTDFGDTWKSIAVDGLAGKIRNFGVARSDGRALAVVASDRQVYLSKDGGDSWETAAGELPGNKGQLSYVSFSPSAANILFVSSVAPIADAHHLWRSTDSGASWEPIDTVANFPRKAPVNIVLGDPGDSETVYAGTHLGLYKSSDGGKNWKRFGFGLPLVSVTDLYIAPDSSLLRIATYGRGIWELTE